MVERFNFERFVAAQERVYGSVIRELSAGRKKSHWMWFVFPQLKGLGRTSTADFYGITSLEEAQAYLRHPLLGQRLRECTELVLRHRDRTAEEIFGFPDCLKVRSSMTLFARADESEPLFRRVLDQLYEGKEDDLTTRLLN